ncbi:MAG: hypothetical protein GYB31_10000 [Bacteroidetes bacterium]|nr:hypothetical protein [Bacteroidota bacterium]
MKNLLLSLIFSISIFAPASAQQELHIPLKIQVSKAHCLYDFMETLAGARLTSPALLRYFEQSSLANDPNVLRLITSWKGLEYDYQYDISGFPPNRKSFRGIKEIFQTFAARAGDLETFRQMTLGLLPNSQHEKFFALLEAMEPYYDQLIWAPYADKIQSQKEKLEAYANKEEVSELLQVIRNFYGSQWPNEQAFIVSLYPIPGNRGKTISTPRSNMLLCGMLLDTEAFAGLLGVALHEIAHTLYDEQPKAFQWEMYEWFDKSDSAYKTYAYTYLNEALATSIGNGWVYKKLSGKLDTRDWYDDAYINGYAKALYPMVQEYLDRELGIDAAFAERAIELFEQEFPQAIFDYQSLFNDFSLFADVGEEEISNLVMMVQRRFRTSSFIIATPIMAEESMDRIESATTTRVFIITQLPQLTLDRMKEVIPEIGDYPIEDYQKYFLLRFLDNDGKAVIIIHSDPGFSALKKGLDILQNQDKPELGEPFILLDD